METSTRFSFPWVIETTASTAALTQNAITEATHRVFRLSLVLSHCSVSCGVPTVSGSTGFSRFPR